MLTALLVMVALALFLGLMLGYSALKFKVEGDPLVDRIDAILPQNFRRHVVQRAADPAIEHLTALDCQAEVHQLRPPVLAHQNV